MNTLIVSSDSRRIAAATASLSVSDPGGNVQSFQGSLDGQAVLPAKGEVDLLILDCTEDQDAQLGALERLAPIYPKLASVLIADADSPQLLMRAMRLGVREIVRPSEVPAELGPAIRRIARLRQGPEQAQGEVSALISCKGGSGATFIASNLGYALASHQGKSVLLLDLNLQFGDAALFISDKRPAASVADIARDIGRLDMALIQSAMIHVLPNFGVIAAPDDPALGGEIRPAQIETLIRFARANFDHVLLDIGRSLDAVSIQALDLADYIYPVFQLTLPFIRDGKRLLTLFSSLNYPKDKIRPIVNRYERSNDLSIRDLERAISMQVFETLPNHYESVAASVNQGVPIARLHKNSPVTRSLQHLSNRILDPVRTAQRGWLSKLLTST